MTAAEQTQYDWFLNACYDPGLAAQLVERGAWLEVRGKMDEETVADVPRYRAERDAAAQRGGRAEGMTPQCLV